MCNRDSGMGLTKHTHNCSIIRHPGQSSSKACSSQGQGGLALLPRCGSVVAHAAHCEEHSSSQRDCNPRPTPLHRAAGYQWIAATEGILGVS